MASLDFMILSKLMSYVFTFLGVLIVLRTFMWLLKDRRQMNKRLKALPDAGTIGVMTVLQGSDELPEGTVIPVPFEGVLGFVRTCDVVVPVDNVVSQHVDFTFRNGKGLYIYPRRGCPVMVDGVTVDSQADSRRYPMQHGSILCVGEAVLQLGVFAGLDVAQFAGTWPANAYDNPPVDEYAYAEDASPIEEAAAPFQPIFRQHAPYPAGMPWPPQERRPEDEA